jgi:hypothetical protein
MRTRSFAPVYKWIEQNTDPNSLILVIGENRIYNLDRRCLAGGNLDGPRVAAYLAQWPTAQTLVEGFRRKGITHVLIHPAWISSGPQAERKTAAVDLMHFVLLSESSKQNLESALAASASLIYRDKDYLLYSLDRAP